MGRSERVIDMTEPQVWTLMGIFGTALLGMMTLLSQFLWRGISSKFDSIDARFDAVDARFDAVDAKFDAIDQRFIDMERQMETRFDSVDKQIAHLDRDVQAVARRVFPE